MKKYIIPVVTLLALGSIAVAGNASAHGMDVKGLSHTKETPEQHQTHLDSRLSALVAQGKITADQKKLIEDKFKVLFDQKQKIKADWKNKTSEERKAAREKEMTDLQKWAKDNGIDPKYLFGHTGHNKWDKNK